MLSPERFCGWQLDLKGNEMSAITLILCIMLASIPVIMMIGVYIGNRIPFDAKTQEAIRLAQWARENIK